MNGDHRRSGWARAIASAPHLSPSPRSARSLRGDDCARTADPAQGKGVPDMPESLSTSSVGPAGLNCFDQSNHEIVVCVGEGNGRGVGEAYIIGQEGPKGLAVVARDRGERRRRLADKRVDAVRRRLGPPANDIPGAAPTATWARRRVAPPPPWSPDRRAQKRVRRTAAPRAVREESATASASPSVRRDRVPPAGLQDRSHAKGMAVRTSEGPQNRGRRLPAGRAMVDATGAQRGPASSRLVTGSSRVAEGEG